MAKWLRRWIANPLFVGSNPTVASFFWGPNRRVSEGPTCVASATFAISPSRIGLGRGGLKTARLADAFAFDRWLGVAQFLAGLRGDLQELLDDFGML